MITQSPRYWEARDYVPSAGDGNGRVASNIKHNNIVKETALESDCCVIANVLSFSDDYLEWEDKNSL